jgi:dihydroneopterin aldolase
LQDLWDAGRNYVRVVLRDVQAEAHVGLHAWERHPERPSRLLVNVEMFAHSGFVDYDPVRAAIRGWPQRGHTDLLETLAEELVGLCFANDLVRACRVSVMKPDIFNEVAAAGVEFYRVRPA